MTYIRKGVRRQGIGSFVKSFYVSTLGPVVVYPYLYTYICVYIYICVCIYVCIYIYIYIYTHIHIIIVILLLLSLVLRSTWGFGHNFTNYTSEAPLRLPRGGGLRGDPGAAVGRRRERARPLRRRGVLQYNIYIYIYIHIYIYVYTHKT